MSASTPSFVSFTNPESFCAHRCGGSPAAAETPPRYSLLHVACLSEVWRREQTAAAAAAAAEGEENGETRVAVKNPEQGASEGGASCLK